METDTKPKIANATPFRIHLEKDVNYFYCTCGESKLQVKFFSNTNKLVAIL